MNNAKMWLVVKPTVGVPIFLAACAIGSFAVHVAVLTNTSWVSDFLSGQPLGSGDAQAALSTDADAVKTAGFVTDRMVGDGDRVMVVLPDGSKAVAVIETTSVLADASSRLGAALK